MQLYDDHVVCETRVTIFNFLPNKKSSRGIRPHCCFPSPRGEKHVTFTQDTSPSLVCSKRRDEYMFGRAKTGCLGQVTQKNKQTKSGYTEPRPDGRATAKKCRCNWKSGTEIKNNVLNNDKLSYIHVRPIETLSSKKQKSLRMQPNGALGNTKTCLYS